MPDEGGTNKAGTGKGELQGIEFEWYPPKAKSNLKKHGVSFEEAKSIFADVNFLDFPDREHSDDELRFIAIGQSDEKRLLFVNFTMRGEAVRVISARVAESWERRVYERTDRYE